LGCVEVVIPIDVVEELDKDVEELVLMEEPE
jgi:hypothetical protein